ncbi:hypothetical protein EDD18DRAFT_1412850 [Armillaria luteobubalina]|uniref:Uncharacterized protein n=1 Tax=Armillaria luteobubalina TaxID=153913 RepID=A0AA39QLV6_9AGAR|nr:hypothetical protein EDD18DRAFT_1412850 [Armillaria luteobubalina]
MKLIMQSHILMPQNVLKVVGPHHLDLTALTLGAECCYLGLNFGVVDVIAHMLTPANDPKIWESIGRSLVQHDLGHGIIPDPRRFLGMRRLAALLSAGSMRKNVPHGLAVVPCIAIHEKGSLPSDLIVANKWISLRCVEPEEWLYAKPVYSGIYAFHGYRLYYVFAYQIPKGIVDVMRGLSSGQYLEVRDREMNDLTVCVWVGVGYYKGCAHFAGHCIILFNWDMAATESMVPKTASLFDSCIRPELPHRFDFNSNLLSVYRVHVQGSS